MAEQRLVLGLSSWLRDSDVPPPEARMSASRVMAGVEVTPRLGRFWPPARLAQAVEPAAELGAYGPEGPPPRPMPRVPKRRIRARMREVVTPIRALAVANVVALTCSVVFVAASMLPRGASPEPEPAAAALLAASPSALPAATPAPTAAPTPTPAPTQRPTWAPSDHTLDWQGDGVRMEADTVRVAIGGRAFTLPAGVAAASVTAPGRTELEGSWTMNGIEQRLVIMLETDGSEWWFGSVRTYDGRKKPAWITFGEVAPGTRTPVGEAYEGDLRIRSTYAERKALRVAGSATLRIDGLRLTAFGPQVPLEVTPS